MSWVWDHSRSKKTERLVLLAIADCASDDGANAYPSTTELMRKTGLSERGVQSAVANLIALGELFVGRNSGPRGCNRYRVNMDTPADPAPGQRVRGGARRAPANGAPPADPAPPPPQTVRGTPANGAPGTVLEPSVEPSVRPSRRSKALAVAQPERSDVERVCRYLADRIEANGSKRPDVTKKWRDSARLLIDSDKRTVEQIEKCIDWCQSDAFWRSNILSMPKLREKYDQLRLQASRTAPGATARPSTTDQRVAQALEVGRRLQAQADAAAARKEITA